MKYKLSCKSVEDLDVGKFLGGKKCNILYTDPPWNNFSYWSTLALKQTGEKLKPTNNDYIATFLNNTAKANLDGFFFLEMGVKVKREHIQKIFNGLYNFVEFDVFYKGGGKWLPSKIYVGSTKMDYMFRQDLSGLKCDGKVLPSMCVRSVKHKDSIVFDPFCGLGNTAKVAVENKLEFYGNEFNKSRLTRTKNHLERHYGEI
jgi:hypothetical protein